MEHIHKMIGDRDAMKKRMREVCLQERNKLKKEDRTKQSKFKNILLKTLITIFTLQNGKLSDVWMYP